jgi:hypothetical protein
MTDQTVERVATATDLGRLGLRLLYQNGRELPVEIGSTPSQCEGQNRTTRGVSGTERHLATGRAGCQLAGRR